LGGGRVAFAEFFGPAELLRYYFFAAALGDYQGEVRGFWISGSLFGREFVLLQGRSAGYRLKIPQK
jgi:hypothetical protein